MTIGVRIKFFDSLVSFYHEQKKYGEVGYDPLFKVIPLLDHFSAVFPAYYFPSMMISTHYRVAFQYLPKKPTKFGIKVWVNLEAKQDMFLLFRYTQEQKLRLLKKILDIVVMDLYEGKNHLLYVDNFYTSNFVG